MKPPSPLLGFNNNFKHKGQVYHIQTEDSGVKHPHIITHLFADGGRILKSIKTSYASVVEDAGMADIVRAMMKEQHKAMVIALRDGQFDPGGAREVKLPTSGPFVHAQTTLMRSKTGTAGGAEAPVTAAVVPAEAVAVPVAHAPTTPALVIPPLPRPPSSPPAPAPAVPTGSAPVPATASPSRPLGSPKVPALDLGDRVLDPSDLPPPPANVLGGVKPQGGYTHTGAPPTKRQSMRPPGSASKGRSVPPPSGQSNRPGAGSQGRYAATRPASIFATNKPAQGSIFGEDLISERSLDEVILSYLAEDLEGEKK